MKTLVRNFSHTFRRFFTASILNILGLSIAFASFFVIMMSSPEIALQQKR